MIRCSFKTSTLPLRTLVRPPQCTVYSRLPHNARNFACATRLLAKRAVEVVGGITYRPFHGRQFAEIESQPASEHVPHDESKKVEKEKKKRGKSKAKDDVGDGEGGDVKPKSRKKRSEGSDDGPVLRKVSGEAKGRRARLRLRKVLTSTSNLDAAVERRIAMLHQFIEDKKQRQYLYGWASAEEDLAQGQTLKEDLLAVMRQHIEAKEQRQDLHSVASAEKDVAQGQTLKEALLAGKPSQRKAKKSKTTLQPEDFSTLDIKVLDPEALDFAPVDHKIPPVPMLSYGLDRVLFNPGIYRLQDPRSRIYNFDPYLEKIMPVQEFNFDALSEYKTSSKDEELLALTQRMGTKFTGSTSSMSGVLQHFHFLLSSFRPLNHKTLSKEFPDANAKFSKITEGPSAIFLRWKDGVYAIDADKAYDTPNIMSWLGHSLEKLLTSDRDEFERYRRSTGNAAPGEDESSRCYHYSKLGNFLMRSQLDAHDPRLPGTGVFDLKTRAVISIRMNHEEYENGKGYQLRYDHGEWESFEREYYDMTRATMLKYSLQVRMGRMDGIFVAYHNVDRIFGFQYLPLEDMDNALHGQKDTCLGDQEFKMSISLLDDLMQRATERFPEQTMRLHFMTHKSGRGNRPFMYIFAEPVTEEQADAIQNKNREAYRAFERDVVGLKKDDPALQAEWHKIQEQVNEELDDVESQESEKAEGGEVDGDSTPSPTEQELVEDAQTPGPGSAQRPLMGWTLVVRHRLNGSYVERPENLKPSDSWTVEYHVREINEDDRWPLYEKVKEKRDKLIGEARDSPSAKAGLEKYRQVIKKYTNRGREWREGEDALAAQSQPEVYRPLGPGSKAQSSS